MTGQADEQMFKCSRQGLRLYLQVQRNARQLIPSAAKTLRIHRAEMEARAKPEAEGKKNAIAWFVKEPTRNWDWY